VRVLGEDVHEDAVAHGVAHAVGLGVDELEPLVHLAFEHFVRLVRRRRGLGLPPPEPSVDALLNGVQRLAQ
jgi:hypothetical protein